MPARAVDSWQHRQPYNAGHLRPSTSSDVNIAQTLQEQEVAWSRRSGGAGHPASQAPVGPQAPGRQLYTWLADTGATSAVPMAAYSGVEYGEQVEIARQRLLQRICYYGLRERHVLGDGNCQFRALADQLYGDQGMHTNMRDLVVWRLIRHPELYCSHVAEEPYGLYCRRLQRPGAWGDHVTLQAAADVFGVRVVVLTCWRECPWVEVVPRVQLNERVVFLSFWAETHYNSLYPWQGAARPAQGGGAGAVPARGKILGSKRLHRLVQVLF